MHLISNLEVENFKSIKKAEFAFSAYTPLVGINNAGKTSVLQALSWIIKKSSLSAAEFHDKEAPVTVTATITGIDEPLLNAIGTTHRQKVEPLVANGMIKIRRTQAEPSQATKDIRYEIWKEESNDWVPTPTGIDAAISFLFPEPIFVGAMENATEDVGKFAAGTTIGKLIKEIIDPVTARHATEINNALEVIGRKLSATAPEKDLDLVAVDNRIRDELDKFFPGVSARVHIPTPEFSDFVRGATLKIFDQTQNTLEGRDASSLGHGAQRSVQIALIKCLSDIKKSSSPASRTTLLLIDEPELYLHPQAIEVVRASLSRLSGEGYQIAFSTHSANMIVRDDAPNTLLIRRTNSEGTKALPRISDAVKSVIADAAHQSEALFALSNDSKILFFESVLLVEGKTERTILPDIYKCEFGASLDEAKIGMIDVGGSGEMPNSMKVLSAMGIPAKAIVDLDFAFKTATQCGLIDSDDVNIQKCKSILQRLANNGVLSLGQDGLPKGAGAITAAEGFAIMALEQDSAPFIDALQRNLMNKGYWLWTKGTIEKHLGLSSKSSSAHYGFVKQYKVDKLQIKGLDHESVFTALSWIRGATNAA